MPDKLKSVRLHLFLTQGEMAAVLWDSAPSSYGKYVSGFEAGSKEPTLPVLLRYARAGGLAVETLIDDKLSLPEGYSAACGRVTTGVVVEDAEELLPTESYMGIGEARKRPKPKWLRAGEGYRLTEGYSRPGTVVEVRKRGGSWSVVMVYPAGGKQGWFAWSGTKRVRTYSGAQVAKRAAEGFALDGAALAALGVPAAVGAADAEAQGGGGE